MNRSVVGVNCDCVLQNERSVSPPPHPFTSAAFTLAVAHLQLNAQFAPCASSWLCRSTIPPSES